jgi:hypothetical protein
MLRGNKNCFPLVFGRSPIIVNNQLCKAHPKTPKNIYGAHFLHSSPNEDYINYNFK